MRRIKLICFDMVKLVILQQIKTAKTHLCHKCPSIFIFFPFMSSSLCPGVFAAALTHRCDCCQWPSSAAILHSFFLFFSFLTKESHENPWQSFMSSLTVTGCLCPFSPPQRQNDTGCALFFLCSAELALSNSAYPWTLIYMFLSLCRLCVREAKGEKCMKDESDLFSLVCRLAPVSLCYQYYRVAAFYCLSLLKCICF